MTKKGTKVQRPICPFCKEVMVRAHIEMKDGNVVSCWLCGCLSKRAVEDLDPVYRV